MQVEYNTSEMTRSDPNLWPTPTWDPDWDGDFAFAALRGFANDLLAHTDLDARLTIIEDGYARLDVFSGAQRIGLVYVNRAIDDPSVPAFTIYAGTEDADLTTKDIAAALRFLNEHRTPLSEDPE